MSTSFLSPGWRMPTNKNQSKQANYSLERNGTGQYVQSDNIPFNSGPSWTISCWVKGANLTSGTTEAFYGTQYYGTTTGGFVIYFKNGGLTFYSSLPGSGSYFTIATATGLLSNNEWQQFVIRYNYGVDYRVYVNNVLRGVNTLNNTKIWPEQNIRLFRHYANDGYSYIGEMTDWCFFNYALSDTSTTVGDTATDQVAAIYGDGSSLPNPMALPNPPIAYYPLGTSAWNGNFLAENNAIGDYVFDFSSDVIDTNSLGISGANARTISCWFNADNTSDQNIIGFGAASSGNNFTIAIYNNNIFAHTWNIGGAGGDLSGSAVTASKWHLAVMTYDGSNLKISLDGGTYATTSASLNTTNSVFKIGSSYYTNWNNFSGKISNTKVWNTDLSQAEVTTLYNYGSPIQTLASIPQSSNLKAWYKLDASEVYNSTTTEWSIDNNQNPSAYPSSLDFDGTSNYIQTPYVLPANTTTFSISMWLNTANFTPLQGFIGSQDSSSDGYWLYIRDNNISFKINGTTNSAPTSSLSINSWFHLVATYDASSVKIYLNSVNSITNSLTETINITANTIIGRLPWTPAYYFNGSMSNISIWNDALTPAQVTEIYNNGTPSNLSSHSATSNLVSWWKLNNTTTGIQDSKGSNNGTNNGATEYAGFVNTLAGDSSGMTQANLVQSNLQTVAPYSKYAMSFDGTSDYIQIPNLSTLNTSGNVSISFWMKTSNTTTTQSPVRLQSSSIGFYIYSDGIVRMYGSSTGRLNSSIVSNDGEWHLVVGVYSTSAQKLYIDNVVTASDVGFQGAISTGGGAIGSRYFSSSDSLFDGQMSNVSVWNTALTSTQVSELYNEGLPSDLNSHSAYSNLVSWWQLGENSSFTGDWIFADEKGSNNGDSIGMGVDALTNGVGTTANGVSSGMGVGALVGDAPYSTANAISSNMSVLAKGTDPADIPS